jgi:hypothetical protein
MLVREVGLPQHLLLVAVQQLVVMPLPRRRSKRRKKVCVALQTICDNY